MTTDSTAAESNDPGKGDGTSRRRFLGWSLGGAGAVAAGAAGFGVAKATDAGAASSPASTPRHIPFYGEHQAGIATPAQDRLAFAAYDVRTADPMALQIMLAKWAAAASRLTQGEPIGTIETAPQSPPIDTGEALGLGPSNLTVTVGFGPSLFDDRFGLSGRRPEALVDLPAFAGDDLDPTRSGGDLCVQACSDDPQVAFHVIRNFSRMGRGVVTMRWSQLGFGRTSTSSSAQATPRNLMGFKDGTNNI
jgi:deferrochelatase/peroxidase EfeB